MKTNIIIKGILGIIVVFMLIIYLIPIPIHKAYTALEIKLDNEKYSRECEILLDGYYYVNIFTDDQFSGEMKISLNEISQENSITFSINNVEGDTLDYIYKDENGNTLYYALGIIFSEFLMKKICILEYTDIDGTVLVSPSLNKYNGGVWSTLNGYCLCTSVETREDILVRLQKYNLLSQ